MVNKEITKIQGDTIISASPSPSVYGDGSLTVEGNLDIIGNIGIVSISNTDDATNSTNGGSFTTDGGLAVAKKAFIGTDLNVGGNLSASNYIEIDNITVPATPSIGSNRFYSDSFDSLLKSINSDGSITTYQPLSVKGDIASYNGNTQVRVPVGLNGRFLKSDDSTSSGLVWGAVPANTYDAIVDVAGSADFTTIKSAVDAGKKSIYIKKGTYVETGNIVISSNTTLMGEVPGGIIITFTGSYSIIIEGSGRHINTGTISVAAGSDLVTGTGTSFTELLVNDYITINNIFFRIASVTNNTSLNLLYPYRGDPIVDQAFIAQSVNVGASLENLMIFNSPNFGIYMNQAYRTLIKRCVIVHCGTDNIYSNIYMYRCGECSIESSSSQDSSDIGLKMTDCNTMFFSSFILSNNYKGGIAINNCLSSVFNNCFFYNNGGSGIYINSASYIVKYSGCVITDNKGDGITSIAGSDNIFINSCYISHNLNYGVNLEGNSNTINNNIINENHSGGVISGNDTTIQGNKIQDNTGNGVNLSAHSRTIISNNIISNNTGIGALSGFDSSITGNLILNNTSDGIRCISGSADSILSSNRISGNNIGIYLMSGANNNIINGNHCKGNLSANITNSGNFNQISGNKNN